MSAKDPVGSLLKRRCMCCGPQPCRKQIVVCPKVTRSQVGFVGVGMRGSGLLEIALAMPRCGSAGPFATSTRSSQTESGWVRKPEAHRPEGYVATKKTTNG